MTAGCGWLYDPENPDWNCAFTPPSHAKKQDFPTGWDISWDRNSNETQILYLGVPVAVFNDGGEYERFARIYTKDPDCKRLVKEVINRAVEVAAARREAEYQSRRDEAEAKQKAHREQQEKAATDVLKIAPQITDNRRGEDP